MFLFIYFIKSPFGLIFPRILCVGLLGSAHGSAPGLGHNRRTFSELLEQRFSFSFLFLLYNQCLLCCEEQYCQYHAGCTGEIHFMKQSNFKDLSISAVQLPNQYLYILLSCAGKYE